MRLKNINDLTAGDILQRKKTGEYFGLKQVIREEEGEGVGNKNFVFFGFAVKERVMRKFFHSGSSGIFVFHDQ